MVMFDFQAQFECRCWFDGFQPQDPETDAQQGMDKEMESNFQLETTWIGNNLQLLCARSKCHSHNSSRFLYCELQQKFSSTYNWWFIRETAEKWKNSWWMMKKVWVQIEKNWENSWILWFWSENVIVDSELSVRIRLKYHPLIQSLNHV